MSTPPSVGLRLTNLCIERPVLAWMMMLATLVFGGLGLARMGVSQYPDVDFPSLSISAVYEGAAPEIVEHGRGHQGHHVDRATRVGLRHARP